MERGEEEGAGEANTARRRAYTTDLTGVRAKRETSVTSPVK